MHDSVFGPILAALLGECVALCSYSQIFQPCQEQKKKGNQVTDSNDLMSMLSLHRKTHRITPTGSL